MKHGFSLLELIVGIALSSIVTSLLYTSFSNILHWSEYGSSAIDLDTRVSVFLHQFEKDVTGMFIPMQALPEPEEEKDKKDSKEKKQQHRLLEKPCCIENKNNMLSMFTCITDNPMTLYSAPQSSSRELPAAGVPYISRVVYTVYKDKEKKDTYSIQRQESATLELQPYLTKDKDRIRGYEIIDNVKSITVSCMRPKNESESPKKDDKKKKEKQKFEYESFSTWPPDAKEPLDLPHMVTVTLTVWDERHENEHTMEAHVPTFVLAQLYPLEEVEPKVRNPKTKMRKPAVQKRGLPDNRAEPHILLPAPRITPQVPFL